MDIRNMTMLDLINQINEADSQEIKNLLIMEFTYRLYVPFKSESFEELLLKNGYIPLENQKQKKK